MAGELRKDGDVSIDIEGRSAAEIAESLRTLIERGALRPGDALPPVRSLAEQLGVNRNTAVAAYRQLTSAGDQRAQARAVRRAGHRSGPRALGRRVDARRPAARHADAAHGHER